MVDRNLSMRDVRRNCLECSGDSAKAVTWCTCDGLHSTRCHFWPHRFGVGPATFRQQYGDRLLTPELMPPHEVDLESLPSPLLEAATAAIDLPGYQQPAVILPPRKCLSEAARERLQVQFRTRAPKHALESAIMGPAGLRI